MAGAVFDVENSIETLVGVMMHFREKGPVFTTTCTLLGVLCHDEERLQVSSSHGAATQTSNRCLPTKLDQNFKHVCKILFCSDLSESARDSQSDGED